MVEAIPINVQIPMEEIAGCSAHNIDNITVTSAKAEKKMATLWSSKS